MMKGIIIVLLLLTAAPSVFAGEEEIQVASIDKEPSPRMKKTYTPPVVTEKYEYYEIRGGSENELRDQMWHNGCKSDDGGKYDSLTRWSLKWDYGQDQSSQACTTDSFKVSLEIIYRFPKWERTDDAPSPLVDKWNSYMENLITHEKGHGDLAVEAASELYRAVYRMPRVLSCAELDRHVREQSRKLRDQLNAEQRLYDATTGHGISQGALF